MTILKNRKQLPNFGYLPNLKIDLTALIENLEQNGLLNFDSYNDIKFSSNSKMSSFVKTNHYCKNTFFKEGEAVDLEGEQYKQLYLTDINSTEYVKPEIDTDSNIFSRSKRLDPNSSVYDPYADELNYGKRNNHVTDVIGQILDKFEDRLTRVRFAVLAPHFTIKPHVDYDPSYICRFHIPIITNNKCTLTIHETDGSINTCHMPADGRVFFLNAGKKHSAENDSDLPRLHLIVDVHGQETIKQLVEFND